MPLGEIWRRIWYRINRSRFERELQQEMAAHREAMADAREFGNVLRLREESRDVWGWGALDRLGEDLRDAVRVLRRAPVFTLAATLILAAGIGLNLTFFHLLNVTMLRAPTVKDPATLVRFTRQTPHFFTSGFPLPAVDIVRRHNTVLATVLARHRSDVTWDADPSTPVNVSFVSANWFAEMGYEALLGRTFVESIDTTTDAPLVVVLSHHFHRLRLGSDPGVVGSQLRLNDRLVTVLGVAPPGFPDVDLDDPQMWLLIGQIDQMNPGTTIKDDWTSPSIELYGRLRQGVSLEAATEGLRPAVAVLSQLQPKRFKPEERFVGASAADRFNSAAELREMTMTAGLVAALTLLVLLVASANLANFILSRAIGRLHEFSIRTALGATRVRIFRQMLVESAVLTAAAAAGAIGLSWAAARIIAARTALPPYLDFTPDASLFAAALMVSAVAMLAFGVAPAWMVSRRDLTHAIKDGGQQASSSLVRARFRLALVGAQVLGCCTLLIVASAIFQGLRHLLQADPGFRVEGAAVLDVSLTRHGIANGSARAYWMQVQETLGANPQVAAVDLAYPAPLGGALTTTGYPDPAGLTTAVMEVGPRFFEVLEIPLLAGRRFTSTDDESAVIVSRRLALRLYGSIDVIGKGFPQPHSKRTIVGVAGDAALFARQDQFSGEEYVPLSSAQYAEAVLVARSRNGAESLLHPLRQAARLADGRVLPKTVVLTSAYETRFRAPRLARLISGLVATLVLALACLGIGGVVAYAVKVRTKEIGIRRALGADARRVCGLLLRQLTIPVGIGVTAGTALGIAASQVLARDPFYLTAPDARGSVLAIIVFVLAALIAALAPVSRALAIDPVRALRHE
jgi:predicted permease